MYLVYFPKINILASNSSFVLFFKGETSFAFVCYRATGNVH